MPLCLETAVLGACERLRPDPTLASPIQRSARAGDWNLTPRQKDYEAALGEPNREKLAEQVAAAENVIFIRLQTISQSADRRAERQAIENALASLRVLKRDKLGGPTGKVTTQPHGEEEDVPSA